MAGSSAFGSARWDFFYSANDRFPYTTRAVQTTTAGSAFTVVAKDASLEVASSSNLTAGDVIRVEEGSGEEVFFLVVKVVDATHVMVRPAVTNFSGGGTTQPFPYGGTINSGSNVYKDLGASSELWPQTAHEVVIDLADAPHDEAYTYLILGAATTYCDVIDKAWTVQVRAQTPAGEIYAEEGAHAAYHQTQYRMLHADAESGDRFPYNCAFVETLTPGQRWSFRQEIVGETTGADFKLQNMRMLALRIDTSHANYTSAGSGGVGQDEQTTALTTWQDGVSLTVPGGVGASDRVLMVGCCVGGNTDVTNRDSDFRILRGASTSYAHVRQRTAGVNNLLSIATAIMDNGWNGDTVKWQFQASTGTAKISQQAIFFIPVEAIPGLAAYEDTLGIGVPTGDTADFSQDRGTQEHTGLTPGFHIGVVSYEGGADGIGDNRGYARPDFSTDPSHIYDHNRTPRGFCGVEHPRGSGANVSCFWFHRAEISGTTLTVGGAQRKPNGGTDRQVDSRFDTFLLRERAKFDPGYQDKTATLAEVETGAVYGSWTSLGSDQFEKRLPDVGLVTTVKVNADTYTGVSVVGSLAAQKWHWDMTTRVLTIQMDTGDAPSDADRVVLVRSVLFYAREYVGLSDSDSGEDRPYEPRILSVPGYSQELQIKEGSIEAGVGIGNLEVAAGDGDLDPLISVDILEGALCTLLRGYPGHSLDRKDYDRVARATISEAKQDLLSLTVRLFTCIKALRRPIATTRITVYEGGSTRDDYLVPHAYGYVPRAQARRTTNLTGNTDINTYKIADHALSDILAVYEDASDPRTVPSTFTKDLPNGEVDVVNQDLAAWDASSPPANAPDTLYVDFVGYAEVVAGATVPIETYGRVVRHLLLTQAGTDSSLVDEGALAMVDLQRRRIDPTTSPRVQLYRPPTISLYIDADQTVEDALNEASRAAVAYWLELRSGRLTVGVPEISARNVLENSGFETDSAEPYPWKAHGELTFATTTSKVFEGARAAQLSGGAHGSFAQLVTFDRTGDWVLSVIAALESGKNQAFRLAAVLPGDGFNRVYSDPFTLNSTEWSRSNHPVELAPGESGAGAVEVIPFLPEAANPDLPVMDDLVLWLKADAMVGDVDATSDGDSVAQWTDQSGQGNHATQGTGVNQPTFRTDVHAGHPAVSFDRTNDLLDTGLDLTQPYTIFAVYALGEMEGVLGTAAIFRNVLREAAGANFIMGARSTAYGVYNGANINGDTLVDGRWVIHSYRVDGSGSEAWVDGVSSGTNANNPAVTDLSLSVADTDGGAFGHVGEVLVFDAALGVADRQAVEDYLSDKWGVHDTSVNVDNAWLVPVDARVETVGGDGTRALNFKVQEAEVLPDSYFEAEVPYNRHRNGDAQTPSMALTLAEAKGIISTYDPDATEEKTAVSTSRRIKLEDVFISNSDVTEARESAAGIAGHEGLVFGRMRNLLRGLFQGVRRMPTVGGLLFHPPTARVPAAATAFPFWLITRVQDTSNANQVKLEVERQIDPVKDRLEIGQSVLPAGVIGVSLIDTAITGYDEVEALRGKYVRGSSSPNINHGGGNLVHTHDLSHTHPLPSHLHTWQVGSVDTIDPGVHFEDGDFCAPGFDVLNTFQGPTDNLARGIDEGGHTHTAPAGTQSSASTSGTSTTPIAAIATDVAGNEAKHKRVVFRRRTGASDEIPTTIMLGYVGTSAPSGWTRETALDGFLLKGATQNDGTATTLTTGWVAADDTAAALTSAANLQTGTRITLVDGGSTTHVIVKSISGLNVTVRLLNEAGDDNAHTYASGTSTVTPDDERVGTSLAPANHDHDAAVPSHQHSAAHLHTNVETSVSSGSGVGSIAAAMQAASTWENVPARDWHTHTVGGADIKFQSNVANASAAAGSAVSSEAPALDSYEVMFIKPSAGGVTEIPSGVVALWDGTTPPIGWSQLGEANDLFIKGAESGQPPVGGAAGGHAHTFTAAAHAYSHTHLQWSAFTDCYKLDFDREVPANPVGPQPAKDYEVASAGSYGISYQKGHRHFVTLSAIQTVDPTLSEVTGAASGDTTAVGRRPLNAPVMLIRKD